MRTNLFKSIAAAALVALAASCEKEQTVDPLGREAEVTFTVASPELQTRAIADGTTVDKVVCNVYNADGTLLKGTEGHEISKTIDMSEGTAKFSVRLVTGQSYSFIFWAYKAPGDGETSPYSLSDDGKTVTVSYEGAVSNDEGRDAFYAYVGPIQITGALSQNVELKRPFAQLNFGVEKDDIAAAAAAGISVSKSKVTLTGLGNTLNLVNGTVTGEVDATFDFAACPTTDMADLDNSGKLTVNSTDYGHVAMNYVLVGKDDKSLTNATLYLKDASGNTIKSDGLAVSNVPLQGNYRTNVLGNLFTSEVITNISVTSDFEEDDINQEYVSITAETISAANTLIEENKEADIIEVKFTAAPTDNTSQAILTTPIKENGTLNVEVSSNVTGTLYVGDYASATYTTGADLTDATTANAATVNLTIPEGVTISHLVIKAGTKTVKINGVTVGAGYTNSQITTLEATTAMNTLVIEKGQTIDKLVFHGGGLEIHGTVKAVELDANASTTTVEVRECENLSSAVYTALEKYIKTGYVGSKNTDGTYDIYVPVTMNGVGYTSLADAVKAAGTGETTITVNHDIAITSNITISGKKIILNTNGYTITPPTGTYSRALEVDNDGELTVTGGGKFIRTGSTGDNSAILNLYSGKLTVGDVYLEGPNSCVVVDGGKAVINAAEMKAINGGSCVFSQGGEIDVYGAKFYCDATDTKGPGACWAKDGGIIRIWDGEFEAVALTEKDQEAEEYWNYCLYDYASVASYGYVAGTITVYGGTFKGFNPASNETGVNYVADGYQSVKDENSDYYKVSKITE